MATKLFLARLLFCVKAEENGKCTEFDEQYRLIRSYNYDDALQKARMIGIHEQETIVSQKEGLIKWEFVDVAELYDLNTLSDGDQVYSGTLSINDPQSYIEYIRRKSQALQVRHMSYI